MVGWTSPVYDGDALTMKDKHINRVGAVERVALSSTLIVYELTAITVSSGRGRATMKPFNRGKFAQGAAPVAAGC